MNYYCRSCEKDAGTALEACFECDSRSGLPRIGKRTLEASRQAVADRRAAARAVPLEVAIGLVEAKRANRSKTDRQDPSGPAEGNPRSTAERRKLAEQRRGEKARKERLGVEEGTSSDGPPRFAEPEPLPYGVSPEGAEHLAAAWMRHLGAADAQVTAYRSDGGVDVVSSNYVAQVKHQLGAVGRPEIQQIAGIANVENKVAVFFTTNRYSSEARNFAEVAGVALFVMNPEEGTLRQVNEAAKTVFPFAAASV